MGWTVYNSDGKVLQSAELGDSSVTSAKIANGAIMAADINASAAIEFSQMENLTTARALVTDGSGDIIVSDVTTTELEILDGLTSSAAELNLLDGVANLVQADFTKLAAVTVTAAEVNHLSNIASNVKTQIDAKAAVGSGTPSTQTLPDTAATGSSTEAARLDHVHTMPAATSEFIGCRITNSSTQSTNSGGTHIVFAGTNSEATMFDTPGSGNDPFWDSSGDTSFINFPVTGKYWCNLSYAWSSSIGTATKADIYCTHYDSGTTRTVSRVTEGSLQNGVERHGQITFMVNVRNAADYLRFVAVDNGNNSLSIMTDNDSCTIFQCFKVD